MSYRHNFIYFKGELEKNSLFLGNKTNVTCRECLKISLRNKADHKKIVVCCIPSYPPIFPLPNTFYGTLGNNYSFFGPIVTKQSRFFLLRSNVRKCMQRCFPAYLPIPKYRVGISQILNL